MMITTASCGILQLKKKKKNNHRERVSLYKNCFLDLKQDDSQFLMKMKDIPTFEQFINLNVYVFQLSSSSISSPPKIVNNNYYGEQMDLLKSN